MVDVVDLALAVAQVDQGADDADDVLLAQHAQCVLRLQVKTHIHLDTADGGKIVALGIEKQRMEHPLGGFERWRFARTHDAVDVEQRVLPRHILLDMERIADIGADVDVIDVEHRDFPVALVMQDFEHLLGDLGASLGVDFAGLHVDEIFGDVAPDQFLVGNPKRLEAFLGELARLAHRNLLAGFNHDLTAVGIDKITHRFVAAHAVRIERNAPALFRALIDYLLVERVEDLLAIHAKREQQGRHRNLPAAVNTRIDDVLGVELDVEPGTAIRNNAGRKQELT